jgi:bifunctional UDP-N-acetylglucosamine pyrophosphorylase/glucosamine-1-phosphate N-acetyltransferase
MKSAIPKVMHRIGGRPMIGYVIDAARAAGASRLAVVVGPDAAALAAYVRTAAPAASIYEQRERLGTAHAVLAARREFASIADDVLVLYGDTPLVTVGTLGRVRRAMAKGVDVVVLGFRPSDPGAYGRLITKGRQLVAIRELKDANAEERAIGFVNGGVMGFRGMLAPLLKRIGTRNAKSEYYLTDLVEIANRRKLRVEAIEADAEEVLGVNSRADLAEAERAFQARARRAAMDGGATLVAPDTVYFSFDTRLGRDVIVEPGVFFGAGVVVADGATIRAHSHLEGARISSGAIVGPFARLRPGTEIGSGAHIGNFVEVKNAKIGDGAKANHLAYIGDAHIGPRTNFGAGAITCNYDGYFKHHTEIGADAFIGTNSALVAPVTIGDGAYIASGSVITHNVAPDAMAVARSRQVDKPEWAAKYRELKRSASRKPD